MSSADFTRAVTVKRNAKKKSGYVVTESEGEYFVGSVPDKARVNVGDKITAINGIRSDVFNDEEDANNLIDSIRLVVVPASDIEKYEAAKSAEENGMAPSTGAKVASNSRKNIDCPECGHKNEDIAQDEDGDYICENCGVDFGDVLLAAPSMLKCAECGHENHDLEPDEEGDLVCEQCGAVLDEDPAGAEPVENEEYECPDCGHITTNPEPDEDGDRICEDCGCILPEKLRCECSNCGRENVDPEANEDGDFLCKNCGEPLDVEVAEQTRAEKLQAMNEKYAQEAGDGQAFGDDGKPTTNQDGKKLTPADMFNPGDVITVTVGKSNPKQDAGLKVERGEKNGKYYVRKVPSSGLFARTPVQAGDRILELNGVDAKDFKDINNLKRMIRDDEKLTIVVLRRDPDASESSADTDIDFATLAPITPDGVMREEIEEREDDTVGYDGNDCGCLWCPDCHPP